MDTVLPNPHREPGSSRATFLSPLFPVCLTKDLIQNVGFACVNLDLIYGIPGQTMESLGDSLGQALEFEPEELFVYPLYVKPGTYLYRQGAECAEDAFEMYRFVREFLLKAGYRPYSMRRFVREKQEPHSINQTGKGKSNILNQTQGFLCRSRGMKPVQGKKLCFLKTLYADAETGYPLFF